MAAYAAVVSLINNIEQMQNHPFHSFTFDKEQIERFCLSLDFILHFLESNSHGSSKEAEALEAQIAAAAQEADDVLESHIVDQIHAGSTLHVESSSGDLLQHFMDFLEAHSHDEAAYQADDDVEILAGTTLHQEMSQRKSIMSLCLDFLETYSHEGSKEAEEADDVIESSTLHGEKSGCFLVELQKVIENMDSVKQMVMKVEAQRDLKDQPSAFSAHAPSSRSFTPGKNEMVGFDDELIRILDLLTGIQCGRQIISITGTGGIGKTILAKNVYDNSHVVHHFDIRIWATISQEYSTRKSLSQLLLCLGKSDAEIDKKTEEELGEQLYKCLWGRRYLIILDDIWSLEAWDNVQIFFPDNNNRSRIVVTSRQSDVAYHLGASCLALKFLDEEKSWNLFCRKAFSGLDCPPELEETGKKIVKKCKGLPLLIVLFGGHLGKSSMMKEYWENFGNDVTSNLIRQGEAEEVEEECFKDHEISVSKLVKLWIAEGFIKPSKSQSLEEVAETCLKDLVDRNLISVRTLRWNGKIKTCGMHDLLRELCSKVAAKEKFFHVLKLHQTPPLMNEARRLVVHGSTSQEEDYPEIFRAMESAGLARSLLCHSTDKGQPCTIDYRLLRVMQSVEGVVIEFDDSFMELKLEQVNLRYLDCRLYHLVFHLMSNLMQIPPRLILPLCLPSSISTLWNLQTLIVNGYPVIFAPPEIWKMPQLRHIAVIGLRMPEPPRSDQLVVLENLQTVFEVMNFRFSEDVCRRIPNVKKLRIGYSQDCEESSYYSPHNLGCLQKLESLRCSFAEEPNLRQFILSFTFPSSLKKLCLENCFLEWHDLATFGSLPNLEVLKLLRNAVVGSEWNPVEGEFLRLKVLIIASIDLVYWSAESCHFPVLERLDFSGVSELYEIPYDVGEIPTLQLIRLRDCSVSAAISAMRIMVEQESLGNEDLRAEVIFSDEEELESFREMVELDGLSSSRGASD